MLKNATIATKLTHGLSMGSGQKRLDQPMQLQDPGSDDGKEKFHGA
jgi:hypothetical protein